MSTRRVTLEIHGLRCGSGGALSVEQALARLGGVRWAYVNPATEMAYVQYDPAIVGSGDLVRAVESAGFQASEPASR